ncbi:MAG: TRAP transporter substrate-binding protein [Eubacteriales bacterium]
MKKTGRTLTAAVLSLLVAASLVGCGGDTNTSTNASTSSSDGGSASTGAEMNLKFAYDDTTTASYYKGLQAFEQEVEEKTGGQIGVEIFADRQLGNAVDTIEGLKMGTIECTFASTAALSGFVPEFGVVDAPFIFRDAEHADAVVDGEIGQWLNQLTLEQQGIRILGYMDTGFRNIYSTKAVNGLSDMNGLKIRTMESEIHVATFEALGCIPSPMPSSEVYTGLSQGTIDAAENCYSYVVNQKLNEVVDYVIDTGHFYGFCPIMIAESVFQKMSEEQQQIILDAGTNCVAYQREIAAEDNDNARVKLQEELGVEVIEVDREELKEACQSVYEQFADVLDPEVIEKIENVGL